jgi:hypothetical protein
VKELDIHSSGKFFFLFEIKIFSYKSNINKQNYP